MEDTRNKTEIKHFLRAANYLEENDDEQVTTVDLIDMMVYYLAGTELQPYSKIYMKKKLHEQFQNILLCLTRHLSPKDSQQACPCR